MCSSTRIIICEWRFFLLKVLRAVSLFSVFFFLSFFFFSFFMALYRLSRNTRKYIFINVFVCVRIMYMCVQVLLTISCEFVSSLLLTGIYRAPELFNAIQRVIRDAVSIKARVCILCY